MSKTMSNGKVLNFLAYRQFSMRFSSMVGAWAMKNSNFIYRVLPHIQLIICLIMALAIFGFVKKHYTNIPLLTRSLSIMTSFIMASIKLTCLIVHRDKVFKLQEILDPYFKSLLEKNHLIDILLKKMQYYRLLVTSFSYLVCASTTVYVIIPLYMNLNQYYHHIQPTRNILVFPSAYPWSIGGIYFQFHFIFESLAAFLLFIISASFESLFSFYVFLIIGQLREISYNITHIDQTNESENIVRKCIIQYISLMKCCDNLQKIYGPIIIYMIATNAITLCSLMFQISQMKNLSPFRIILFTTYISSKFLQTLTYTWCGTQLIIESEDYRRAIYTTNWYGNKRVMSYIIIMLQQKPLILSACYFTDVTIEIFVKIVNTTISYFLMLRTLEDK